MLIQSATKTFKLQALILKLFSYLFLQTPTAYIISEHASQLYFTYLLVRINLVRNLVGSYW